MSNNSITRVPMNEECHLQFVTSHMTHDINLSVAKVLEELREHPFRHVPHRD